MGPGKSNVKPPLPRKKRGEKESSGQLILSGGVFFFGLGRGCQIVYGKVRKEKENG